MRILAAFATLLLLAGSAFGQSFPNRPLRVVVTFAPGGGADVVTRVLTPKMSELLGQPVVVENRPGAGGNVGAEAVARAPADGYTLLVATGAQAINQTLTKDLSWNLLKDFTPVVGLVINQTLLTVHPSVPASSVKELIALAKRERLTYASYGNGSTAHMGAELFKMMTGVDMVHVPYKGAAPAVNDIIGGQVQVIFCDMAAILQHVKSGKAKAIAVGSSRRFGGLPGVPTVAEAGVPGYETGGFLALVAPAGTPRAAVDAINAATRKTMDLPEIRERLEALAGIPIAGTPEELGTFLKADVERYARIIRTANIRAD
jgi:tripartite-type tricarboxylate transporter receptor subunit TctC